jgi:hypothetical protein
MISILFLVPMTCAWIIVGLGFIFDNNVSQCVFALSWAVVWTPVLIWHVCEVIQIRSKKKKN